MATKKAISLVGLSEKQIRSIGATSPEVRLSVEGVACNKRIEAIPSYNAAPCEKVIAGENNTFIVLGRDRPGARISGYGGRGDTGAGSIDIVVGRMGGMQRTDMYVDPDFETDAARIHISQRSDVDANFNLSHGMIGNSVGKSSIGLKADAIRIIGREGVKIISGYGNINSHGGLKKARFGIDLIANNDDSELEPMVKGKKLVQALEVLKKEIENLSGALNMFVVAQMSYNSALASHTHVSSPTGGPTSPSILAATGAIASLTKSAMVVKDMYANRVNLLSYKYDFLSPVGKHYINSRYNNVN